MHVIFHCMPFVFYSTDVVGAYKSLLKEKEALESSLKALGTPRGCSSPHNRTVLQVPTQQTPGEESDQSIGPSPTNQVVVICALMLTPHQYVDNFFFVLE